MNNFHYVSVMLQMMYGIELPDEDYEELGLIAWGNIGNRNRKLYRYCTSIDPTDNSVTLPCNALEVNGENCVELVTIPYEDWSHVTNYSEQGDRETAYVESVIEGSKYFQGPYYMSGKILKYEKVGDKLYFTHNYGKVNILYKGILSDEDGLPEITDKEAVAIATYIAYITKYKEGLKNNNGDMLKLSQTLYQQWQKQCDQARVRQLSQNEMDSVLEVGLSWDRKRYGVGYKILK